ncbi:unnamed protein product [Prunus brigantina]
MAPIDKSSSRRLRLVWRGTTDITLHRSSPCILMPIEKCVYGAVVRLGSSSNWAKRYCCSLSSLRVSSSLEDNILLCSCILAISCWRASIRASSVLAPLVRPIVVVPSVTRDDGGFIFAQERYRPIDDRRFPQTTPIC